jgi:hypothetical protein
MTPSEAVEAAGLGVSLALNVICAACFLRHWLERRQMAATWKARLAAGDHKILLLPSRCTCCPAHGPGITTGDYMRVQPAETP